jgi:hypothetical protein
LSYRAAHRHRTPDQAKSVPTERAAVKLDEPLEGPFKTILWTRISEINRFAMGTTSREPTENLFHGILSSVFFLLDGME